MDFDQITINLKTPEGVEKFHINRCFDKIYWSCDGDKLPDNVSEKCKNFICWTICLCCDENDFTFQKYKGNGYDYNKKATIIGLSKIDEIEEKHKVGTYKYRMRYIAKLKIQLQNHCKTKNHKRTFKIWDRASKSRIEELQNPAHNEYVTDNQILLFRSYKRCKTNDTKKKGIELFNNFQNIISNYKDDPELVVDKMNQLNTEEKEQLKEIIQKLED